MLYAWVVMSGVNAVLYGTDLPTYLPEPLADCLFTVVGLRFYSQLREEALTQTSTSQSSILR